MDSLIIEKSLNYEVIIFLSNKNFQLKLDAAQQYSKYIIPDCVCFIMSGPGAIGKTTFFLHILLEMIELELIFVFFPHQVIKTDSSRKKTPPSEAFLRRNFINSFKKRQNQLRKNFHNSKRF